MGVQIMHQAGVPCMWPRTYFDARIAEVNRGVLLINDHKAVDVARLLGTLIQLILLRIT